MISLLVKGVRRDEPILNAPPRAFYDRDAARLARNAGFA
jgi:hypothetical protein